jgi:cell division protein FtsI/penicillin-binding protein 2
MRAVKGQVLESFSVLTKSDLRGLIDPDALCNGADGRIDIICSGKFFSIETTLDKGLQSYMLKEIQASQSPMIGFVAMDPATGRILSMVDSKRVNGEKNICLSSRFPAASIFKIVSAAAAIDRCNISADTKLTYNGRRHTLYRNQLNSRTNRHTNSISLKTSFATSINPVFGKLGIFRLKRDLLEEYAIRFGFNQPIDFELPVEISRISIRDDPYNWAEVACGFNRETLISPIHGAMMAAVIINDGRLVEPTIIGCITDDKENPVYIGTADIVRQVISREASQEMQELMSATISRGTCSGTFKGYRRDRILSKLSIGGKTGSISDISDELHYDWFVGFCAEKAGTKKLALAVLVVHDELLREKAQEFARRAMRCYFRQSVG